MSHVVPRCARSFAPPWSRCDGVAETFPNYRTSAVYNTRAKCAASLFEWHTETMNAWTMILQVIVLAVFYTYFLTTRRRDVGFDDSLLFTLFCLFGIAHGVVATLFHLFMPISEDEYMFWRKLDTTFASLGFTAAGALVGYYAFSQTFFFTYLAFLCAVQIFMLYNVSGWADFFIVRADRTRYVTALMTVGLVLPFVPFVFLVFSDDSTSAMSFASLVLIPTGLVIFYFKIPETFVPSASFPMSHCVMHGVVLAVVSLIFFVALSLFDNAKKD